jgi:hypothetical protein
MQQKITIYQAPKEKVEFLYYFHYTAKYQKYTKHQKGSLS